MSEHHDAGGSGVLLVSGLVSLLLAGGLLYFFSSSASPIESVDRAWFLQPEVTIDAAEIEASRQKHYTAEMADAPEFEAYRDAFRAANLLQFTAPKQDEFEKMSKLLAVRADDAITQIRGPQNFLQIGEPIFEECNKALDGILIDIVEGRISITEAASPELSANYEVYKRNCGNVIPQLVASKLITDDGEWRRPGYGPAIFDILQRYRFANQISLRIHPSDSLSPVEYRELTEWRLLVPESFGRAARVENLSRALRKPPEGLNLDRAEAFVMASSGHWNRARKAYQRVCDSGEATTQDHLACDWLRNEQSAAVASEEAEAEDAPTESPKK